jgi:hypothetical protein
MDRTEKLQWATILLVLVVIGILIWMILRKRSSEEDFTTPNELKNTVWKCINMGKHIVLKFDNNGNAIFRVGTNGFNYGQNIYSGMVDGMSSSNLKMIGHNGNGYKLALVNNNVIKLTGTSGTINNTTVSAPPQAEGTLSFSKVTNTNDINLYFPTPVATTRPPVATTVPPLITRPSMSYQGLPTTKKPCYSAQKCTSANLVDSEYMYNAGQLPSNDKGDCPAGFSSTSYKNKVNKSYCDSLSGKGIWPATFN